MRHNWPHSTQFSRTPAISPDLVRPRLIAGAKPEATHWHALLRAPVSALPAHAWPKLGDFSRRPCALTFAPSLPSLVPSSHARQDAMSTLRASSTAQRTTHDARGWPRKGVGGDINSGCWNRILKTMSAQKQSLATLPCALPAVVIIPPSLMPRHMTYNPVSPHRRHSDMEGTKSPR